MTRAKLEALLWKDTHRDFRGTANGVRSVLHLNPKTGGTESWPLSCFSDEELIAKMRRATRDAIEAERAKTTTTTTKGT